MPAEVTVGTRIPTMYGKSVTVLRYIGSGGQGSVYEVLYDGEHKALKWYHPGSVRDPKFFVNNLIQNIRNGAPTPEFLWPQDLTDFHEGSYGYVMDLRPPTYAEVNDFLLNHAHFPSFRRAVDACLGIVSAFRILHDEGYAYQDINSKNFFINPDKGKILICDNDNVVPNDAQSGIRGTWGFMAPEVVKGGHPNTQSDLHSMAVLLFLLLFKVHPLEGRSMASSVLDDTERMRIYATDSLFVFDERDHSNALSPETNAENINLWKQMPGYLRDLFSRAFSQEALGDPRRRPIEVEWTRALARFRSEIQRCPCGNTELVLEGGKTAVCEVCGRAMSSPLVIDMPHACLPALYDTRIYACQLGTVRPDQALDLVGWVVPSRNDMRVLGLSNQSRDAWEVSTSCGLWAVQPQEVVRLEDGLVVRGRSFTLSVRRSS